MKFYFVMETKTMTIEANVSGCTKALCPFHSSTKVLSPAVDLIPRPTLLLYGM